MLQKNVHRESRQFLKIGQIAQRKEKNFIKANTTNAFNKTKQGKLKKDEDSKHKNFGKVPKYLQDINKQRYDEEEKVKAALRDPDCPPGSFPEWWTVCRCLNKKEFEH